MNSTNIIKILSDEQAMKIAAGEVVERPSNIIKELVENSIDAHATKISIFIERAGKKIIKIIDNGIGMSPEDAQLSVAAHATSKITCVDELESITTFGFRGEALASINAVSSVTITTKKQDAQIGSQISWKFGKLEAQLLQSHPTGTTIEIKNLFDNIPARQKFLKKDETEWRAIVTLFQAFCLDYQQIHFQLYHDEVLQYNCPAVSTLADRIGQLFDYSMQKNMDTLHETNTTMCSIRGLISKPHYYRYDRNQIFIFVNSRWVKNIDLTKAIMRGYAGIVPVQKYPAAIVFITIDPQQVDINIHPKKEEIKFLHPKKIETLITASIKETLGTFLQPQHVQTPVDFFTQKSSYSNQRFESQPVIKIVQPQSQLPTDNNFFTQPEVIEQKPFIPNNHFAAAAFEQLTPTKNSVSAIEPNEQISLHENQDSQIFIIGQYKKTYLLCEKNNNLLFIDQHAAHERILYEQRKKNKNSATIQLIFPEIITLSQQDVVTIAPHLNTLQNHGIAAEVFSDTQIMITATPVHLKNQLLQETIHQIVGWIVEFDSTDYDRITSALNDNIDKKIACSAAVKAGDLLDNLQMQQILDDLIKTEDRFSCPHGRPTFWTLPIDYLEKQFKRDYTKKAEQLYDFL